MNMFSVSRCSLLAGRASLTRLLAFSLLAALFTFPLHGSNWKSPTRDGVKEFKKKDYLAALKSFEKAKKADPQNPLIEYNQGCALYRIGDWEATQKSFEKISRAPGIPDKAKAAALYNEGNTRMNQAKPKEALEAYKHALLLNPKDPDAKHNLALALRLLKEQQRQQPPKQEEKNQQQQKGGQNQKQPQPKPRESMGKEDLDNLMQSFEEEEREQAKKMRRKRQESSSADHDW